MNAINQVLADPNVSPWFKVGVAMTLPDVMLAPGQASRDRIAAANAVIDRAVEEVAERTARDFRVREILASKRGAELILAEWRKLGPALSGSFRAKRQARIALRWRRRFGTLATPPTRRIRAMEAAIERSGGGL